MVGCGALGVSNMGLRFRGKKMKKKPIQNMESIMATHLMHIKTLLNLKKHPLTIMSLPFA